jgi:Ca-activated chloride channel family protein
MKTKWALALFLGLILFLGGVNPVQADGIIIPDPIPCVKDNCPPTIPFMRQLEIKYHHVTVSIDNQIAVTRVDQVFYNPNSWTVEGTYTFPLPKDALVSNFMLWVDGKAAEGKVLNADQARQQYEEIVRSQKDPALLEYVGRGAVQASIFPIQPGEERKIELEYQQSLTADNGLVGYTYPLNTEKFSTQPLDDVSIDVKIKTGQPIRAVYSPSHTISVDKIGSTQAEASYEAKAVTPDTDFTLYYSIGQAEAFHLFTYRDPGDPSDPDGYFALLLAPRPETGGEVVNKDVFLVLDHSGSMDGAKFRQAQQAAGYILKHLNPGDRFLLTTFSTNVDMYSDRLRQADEANEAIAWLDQVSAAGSTDINRALLETVSLADPDRPAYLIFLTDGLPTQGVLDSKEILRNFTATAPKNLRVFAFGVGYDVDTYLLDSLTQEHHGLSTYVKPGEALDEILSSFYARISTPVLTNLKLDFGKLTPFDVYPNPLPDLFAGSQVVVVGRYRAGETADVALSGQVNGQTQTFRFANQYFAADSRTEPGTNTNLPRLWATRKIGYLLNKIRLEGADQEMVEQIIAISVRYGIVTEYTSYLVSEPQALGAENQERLAQDTYNQMQAQPSVASGQAAVEKAAGEGALFGADVAPSAPQSDAQTVRVVGTRTFVLSDGIWMDTAYDPGKMKPIQVSFLSDDYFKLANSRADIGAALALGERVIALIDGKAYEIVVAGTQTAPLVLPPASTPAPATATPRAGQSDGSVDPENPSASDTPLKGMTLCSGALLPIFFAEWMIRRR